MYNIKNVEINIKNKNNNNNNNNKKMEYSVEIKNEINQICFNISELIKFIYETLVKIENQISNSNSYGHVLLEKCLDNILKILYTSSLNLINSFEPEVTRLHSIYKFDNKDEFVKVYNRITDLHRLGINYRNNRSQNKVKNNNNFKKK
jgi:hypothetical protein